jgi:hypothetical protein
MTIDASGFGVMINLQASETFPAGIELTRFADDADPIDMPQLQINDKAMGVNGDLVKWSKANPIPLTIAVLPNNEDDDNLQVLAMSNRAVRGRRPVRDIITATITYPDGSVVRLLRGIITDAPIGKSVASSGRIKTNSYVFAFEDAQ